MDKFEEALENVNSMAADERDKAIQNYKDSCICQTCASYTECSKDANEKLFCVTGKSNNCITELKGCECPACPLARSLDVGILHNAYCLNGSEMEQR